MTLFVDLLFINLTPRAMKELNMAEYADNLFRIIADQANPRTDCDLWNLSNCCNAPMMYEDTICSDCKEHCSPVCEDCEFYKSCINENKK